MSAIGETETNHQRGDPIAPNRDFAAHPGQAYSPFAFSAVVSGSIFSKDISRARSLGRQLREIGLLTQKAITLRFRDDDDADAWDAFD